MKPLRVSLDEGEVLLDRLLRDGVDISHDCGGVLSCSSCRVVVREGHERLRPASVNELDLLDRADENVPGARLACQVEGIARDLLVEVPHLEAARPECIAPVSVSARAAMHFAEQLARRPGAVAVRLAVKAAGCSGLAYRVNPADAIADDDHVFESHGVRIVVDAASLPFVTGTMLDVVDDGLARRVRFANPNVRRSCGCGESFAV